MENREKRWNELCNKAVCFSYSSEKDFAAACELLHVAGAKIEIDSGIDLIFSALNGNLLRVRWQK